MIILAGGQEQQSAQSAQSEHSSAQSAQSAQSSMNGEGVRQDDGASQVTFELRKSDVQTGQTDRKKGAAGNAAQPTTFFL
jgi:hypothetical protein